MAKTYTEAYMKRVAPRPPRAPAKRVGSTDDVGLDTPIKGVGLTPRDVSKGSDPHSIVRESEYARTPQGQRSLGRSMRGRR